MSKLHIAFFSKYQATGAQSNREIKNLKVFLQTGVVACPGLELRR